METIIIPIRNEAGRIRKTIDRIFETLDTFQLNEQFEIIVVDNDCRDDSISELQNLPIRIISCSEKGKGMAMRYGARAARGNHLIFIDGDNTYDPSSIPVILLLLRRDIQLVRGNRFLLEGQRMPFIRYWGNLFLIGIVSHLYHCAPGDFLSGFFGLSRENFLKLELKSSGFEIEAEIFKKSFTRSWNIVEIPVRYRGRNHSRLAPIRDGWKILKTFQYGTSVL